MHTIRCSKRTGQSQLLQSDPGNYAAAKSRRPGSRPKSLLRPERGIPGSNWDPSLRIEHRPCQSTWQSKSVVRAFVSIRRLIQNKEDLHRGSLLLDASIPAFRGKGSTRDSNLDCFVSRIRRATTNPDRNVNPAINPMEACTPRTSATTPAKSAPTA